MKDLMSHPHDLAAGPATTDAEEGRPLQPVEEAPIDLHHAPVDRRDWFALKLVKFMRVFADAFFSKRYGHRAVVLETVAAVPGMVGGLLQRRGGVHDRVMPARL